MALDRALPSGTEASAPVILSAGKGPGARWHRPLLAVFFFFLNPTATDGAHAAFCSFLMTQLIDWDQEKVVGV